MEIQFILYFNLGSINKNDIIELYRNNCFQFIPRGMYIENVMESEGRFSEEKFINNIQKLESLTNIEVYDVNGFDFKESFVYYPVGKTVEFISFTYIDKLPEVEKFSNLLKKEGFIHAAILDRDFYHWQNETDIDIYKLNKRSIEPYYLTKDSITGKKIIDVSHNPGSKITFEKDEVKFIPCWTMYFGKLSYKYISKEQLLKYDSLENLEIFPDVVKIKLFDKIGETVENIAELHRFRKYVIPETVDNYAPKLIKKRFFKLW